MAINIYYPAMDKNQDAIITMMKPFSLKIDDDAFLHENSFEDHDSSTSRSTTSHESLYVQTPDVWFDNTSFITVRNQEFECQLSNI